MSGCNLAQRRFVLFVKALLNLPFRLAGLFRNLEIFEKSQWAASTQHSDRDG